MLPSGSGPGAGSSSANPFPWLRPGHFYPFWSGRIIAIRWSTSIARFHPARAVTIPQAVLHMHRSVVYIHFIISKLEPAPAPYPVHYSERLQSELDALCRELDSGGRK